MTIIYFLVWCTLPKKNIKSLFAIKNERWSSHGNGYISTALWPKKDGKLLSNPEPPSL